MNIPKKIKVGGLIYKINIIDRLDGGNTSGEIQTEKQIITLTHGEKDFLNCTFIHELLHAINMEMKEVEIEFLAQALYQVIKDNPMIFKNE